MTVRAWLRGGLLLLTVIQLIVSAWQLIMPQSFYDDLPTVAMYPPFNEHLMRDLGSMGLALTVVLGAAAVTMERRLVLTALAAYLTWCVAHLAFHSTSTEPILRASPEWAVSLVIALAVNAVIPMVLLILAFTRLPWARD